MSKVYAKFLVQVVAAVLAVVAPALFVDRSLDASEWVNAIALGLGAIMVLNGGELPAGVWSKAKFYISAAIAGVVVVQSALSDSAGITAAEWVQVALAVLAALGVLAAPGPKVTTATGPAIANGPVV